LDIGFRTVYYPSVPTWIEQYRDSLTEPAEIAAAFGLDAIKTKRVLDRYPALINRYYRRLCAESGAPLIRQVIPDPEEISSLNESLPGDPICEDVWSPVPNLTHRYEDRVLFLVSDVCPVYCRFCTRKRKIGRNLQVTEDTITVGINYIKDQSRVRDVLLSGGDPLMLDDDHLESILDDLRRIEHVQILRVGSRVPAALPQRITPRLSSLLRRFGPLYIHTHFNHPAELTEEAREACRLLADEGIPLANQTVLLRGINDNTDILEALFRELLTVKVRPYYLFQVDTVRGTAHFSTPLLTGLRIIEDLRKRTSPMSIPCFALDLPEGAGKIFPSFATVFDVGEKGQTVLDTKGIRVHYPDIF
jgi:lysine 2,3-aminomutase